MIQVAFHGVDSWGRPVFKDIESKSFYGDTDNLFNCYSTEQEILESVTAKDLIYFGSKFDCEPLGTLPSDNIEILVPTN